jgi:hypothetical protein
MAVERKRFHHPHQQNPTRSRTVSRAASVPSRAAAAQNYGCTVGICRTDVSAVRQRPTKLPTLIPRASPVAVNAAGPVTRTGVSLESPGIATVLGVPEHLPHRQPLQGESIHA